VTDHRRVRSSPWGAVAILLLGMVVVGGLIVGVRWLTTRDNAQPSPEPTATASPSDSASQSPTASPTQTAVGAAQQTLLMQVRDDRGLATDNVLLGTTRDPDNSTFVGVPPRLLVDIPGGPQTVFAQTTTSANADQSQIALSNLLGIGIDATWTLDRLALTGLVDSIGGIYLDVKTPVTIKSPAGKVLLTLPVGIAKLDGPKAAIYILTAIPGEKSDAQMARYQEVVRQILLQLPPDSAKVELLLGSLGSLSHTTVPADQLSQILVRLHANVDRSHVTTKMLPVVEVKPKVVPAAVPVQRLDFVAAQQLMTDDFALMQLQPGPNVPVRVLVQNGTSTIGLAATARAAIEAADEVYLSGGNAIAVGYTESIVSFSPDVPGADVWAAAVAKALKLPATSVRPSNDPPTTANVDVVLGADYKPATPPSPEPTISPEASATP